MSTPHLYGIYGSTCTQGVLFTATELGVKLDFTTVDFMKGQHKTPEWIENRQPFGKVPAFEDGDLRIFESRAISRYLVEKYGKGSTLIPSTPEARAVFEQWACVESQTLTPEIGKICLWRCWASYKGLQTDPVKAKQALTDATTALAFMDKTLGKTGAYIAGENLTLVDIFPIPYLTVIKDTEEFKEILATYPNISAWWTRVTSRPAWKQVLELSKN